MVAVHHKDRDQHIDTDQDCSEAGEQTQQDQNSADKLRQGRHDSQPVRKAEGRHIAAVMLQRGKGIAAMKPSGGYHLAVAVEDHGRTQNKPEKKSSPRLQTIKRCKHKFRLQG